MSAHTRLGSFLKRKGLKEYITECAQRALQGNAPSGLLEYSFSIDESAKRILFKAEVERELSQDERDSLMVAETEVYADFGDDTLVETMIEVVPPGSSLDPLPGGVVFQRDQDGSRPLRKGPSTP